MSRSIVVALAVCLLVPAAAMSSGQSATTTPPASGQKPKPEPKPTTPSETPQPESPFQSAALSRTPPQSVNLRVELTITDQRGAAPAAPKTVTMLTADRSNGRIRTTGQVRVGGTYQPITLNVDAQPEVLRDGRIRLQVSLEYRAQTSEGSQEDTQPSSLTETFNVILDDGKSMLVTQSADPASDRKVKVDLKATLVK
jgi:hypothetical protein